jgi:hypothetical protein
MKQGVLSTIESPPTYNEKKNSERLEKKEIKPRASRRLLALSSNGDLSVDNLYQLDDSSIGPVIKDGFFKQLQSSSFVQPVFFAGIIAPIPPENATFVNNLACAVVCRSIAQSSLYGFNKTVNYSSCDVFISTQFASTNVDTETSRLYDYYFPVQCTKDGHSFQEYMADSAGWAQRFSSYVTTDQFVNVEIVELIAGRKDWLYVLNLIIYKLNRLDPSVAAGVQQCWNQKFSNIIYNWSSYKRFLLSDFSTDEFMTQVIAAISTSPDSQPIYDDNPYSHGIPLEIIYTYGQAVSNFLAGQPTQLGFTTSQKPDNVVVVNDRNLSSVSRCTENSLVLLEDGKSIPIKNVADKDRVVAINGAISTHTNERVVTILKHDTFIYGINDEKPFFTSGHLFWTSQGWKAIDVAVALKENPGIEAKELKIGDSVQKIKSINPLTYQSIKITEFTKQLLPAGSKVYGMHLEDGPASYHANGYCVRMNYPVITEKRLFNGFLKLSEAERHLILKQLTPVMPLLTKAGNSFIEELLHRSLQIKKTPSLTLKSRKGIRKETLLDKPSRNYTFKVYDHSKEVYEENKELIQLSLKDGKLILNNQIIHQPILRGNELVWCQRTAKCFTGGLLQFNKNWAGFLGTITIGKDQKSAETYSVSGTVPPSEYTSTLQDNTNSTPSQPGLQIRLSYIGSDSNINAVIECKNQDLDAEWSPILNEDITYIGMSIAANGNLILDFSNQMKMNFSYCYDTFGPTWPIDGQIEFSWDGNSFSGTQIKLYDESTIDGRSKITYIWNGTISTSITSILTKTPESDPQLKLTDLSLYELISLIPDSDTVADMSNTMLIENMKWAIGGMNNDWLADFFGEIRPYLSQDRQNLINKDLDFYQNKFAMGYLGWGIGQMTGAGAPSEPLTQPEMLKLKYYMQNGLAKEKAYTTQTIGISSDAYLAVAPGVNDYIADGGDKWAKQVNAMITSPQKVNLMAMELVQDPTKATQQMKRYASLLSVLKPDSQYAQQYLQHMVSAGLFTYTDQMPLTDMQTLPVWLTDFINQFISKYINSTGGDGWETISMQSLAQDMQDTIKEIGTTIDLANRFAAVISSIMSNINRMESFMDDSVVQRMASKFIADNPKLAKIAKWGVSALGAFFKLASLGFAVFSITVGFTNWKNITDAQRADVVLQTLQLVEPVIRLFIKGYSGAKKILDCLKTAKAGQLIPKDSLAAERLNNSIKRSGEAGAEDADIIVEADGEIEIKAGTLIGRLISEQLAAIAFKVIGAAFSLAFAGLATYNFVEDILNGQPIDQEAMDGVIAASTVGIALCDIITLVSAESVLGGVASIAGPVLALVGVVVAMVEMFKPQPKPESPTDKFMDSFRVFLSAQDNPPSNFKNSPLARLLRLTNVINSKEHKNDSKNELSEALFLTSNKGSLSKDNMPLTLWNNPKSKKGMTPLSSQTKEEKNRLVSDKNEEEASKDCCPIT